jgi:hypothetical protein
MQSGDLARAFTPRSVSRQHSHLRRNQNMYVKTRQELIDVIKKEAQYLADNADKLTPESALGAKGICFLLWIWGGDELPKWEVSCTHASGTECELIEHSRAERQGNATFYFPETCTQRTE